MAVARKLCGESRSGNPASFSRRLTTRPISPADNGALFERTVLSPTKLSAPLRELHPDAASLFKDTYLVEFIDLPPRHSEADLQRGLIEAQKSRLSASVGSMHDDYSQNGNVANSFFSFDLTWRCRQL